MSGSRRSNEALFYLTPPLVLTLIVFFPVTRSYFYGDDFVHLVEIVNRGLGAVLWRPYMSHLYVLPTLVYWGFWETFGLRPAPYFCLVLALHLLNVALVFRAVRLLTESPRIASVAALVWGTWSCHEGSLAWFCVHGHVVAGTTMLLALNGLAAATRRATVGWQRAALWATLLAIGATCFGTAIAVAMVFPLIAILCLGRRLSKPAVAVLLALPVVVAATFVAVHIAYPVTPGPRPEQALHTFGVAPGVVLSMWRELWAFGIGSLVVGFFWVPSPIPTEPLRYPSPVIYVISIAVVLLGAIALARSSPGQRRWLAALFLAVAAAYGLLAAGRAFIGLQIFHIPPAVMASCTCRYHYVPSVGIILMLALIAAAIGKDSRVSERMKDAGVALLFLVVAVGFMRSGWRIDLHPDSRQAVSAVVEEARVAARAVPSQATAYIVDRAFEPFVIFQPEFTSAAVFSLLFPDDVLDGRHIRYIQRDTRVVDRIPAGSRLSRLVVAGDAVGLRDARGSDGKR